MLHKRITKNSSPSLGTICNTSGQIGKVEVYGTKYPIEDCRSGTYFRGYLYYNGYIPANRINSVDARGRPNGVMGVPESYRPASQPVFPTPKDGGSPSDPNFAFYETNTVFVKLKDGSLQRTTVDTNLHPWRNQFIPGPIDFGLAASLFKNTRITERFVLRFNADFFNVLNMPGLTQPDSSTGILSLRNSQSTARQLRLTLRLTWQLSFFVERFQQLLELFLVRGDRLRGTGEFEEHVSARAFHDRT